MNKFLSNDEYLYHAKSLIYDLTKQYTSSEMRGGIIPACIDAFDRIDSFDDSTDPTRDEYEEYWTAKLSTYFGMWAQYLPLALRYDAIQAKEIGVKVENW